MKETTRQQRMSAKLVCVLVCFCLLQLACDRANTFSHEIYPPQITTGCGQSDPLHDDQLNEALNRALQQLSPPGCNPPRNRSCPEILYCFPSAPSGYHEIRVPNGSLVQVYCDMEGTNCGGQGGWMRVAYINMSQPDTSCPQGLTQKEISGQKLCGQTGHGCTQATMLPVKIAYSRVCGRLQGFQYNTPDAFGPYNSNNSLTLCDNYVEGASITYGTANSLKHIWTYACVFSLGTEEFPTFACPCNINSTAKVPHHVGEDYRKAGYFHVDLIFERLVRVKN